MFIKVVSFVVFISCFVISQISFAELLSDIQKKELTLFGMKAIGINANIGMVKNIMSKSEINKMVATGLNANGHLCANVVHIIPLIIKSKYEVECITYRGGQTKKSYIIDSLQGVAFIP